MAKRLSLIVLLLVCGSVGLMADSANGTVFVTTFAPDAGNGLNGSSVYNVWSVSYNFNGASLTLGTPFGVALTPGADGLLFAPDKNLLVAGQGTGHISEVNPTTGALVNNVAAGTGSFHLALSSDTPGATLFNMWNGGGASPISQLTLSGGGLAGAGTPLAVTCDAAHPGCDTDVRGVVFDPNNGTWYYGSAGDGAVGDFGTVAFGPGTATLTPILTGVPAHGETFDPFTGDIIFSSAGEIDQFDPNTNTVVSKAFGFGNFDQSAVDGKGHLFVASNSGLLMFVDYDASKLIGAGSFATEPGLLANLDDVAPLSGSGSRTTVPEPGSILLLGTALAGFSVFARQRGSRSF